MNQFSLLRKHTPRWVIFIIDIFISLTSILIAYLLRFNFSLPDKEIHSFIYVLPFVLIIRAISFGIGGTYAGIVRYTSTKDAERIFVVMAFGSLVFVVSNMVSFYNINGSYFIPFSVIIIDFITNVFIMTSSRILVKILYLEMKGPKKQRSNIIIYGTDQPGIITKRTLDRNDNTSKVVAFIDNTRRNVGKKLEGVTIYSADDIEYLLKRRDVSKVIIAKAHIGPTRKKELIETCLNYDVKVLTVPVPSKWINGELSFNQIKDVNIVDLLGRDPISLDIGQIKKQVAAQIVLITGAAGSIGSEIVRQLTKFNPEQLILVDQAESPLYDIELEIKEELRFHNLKVVIGDVTDKNRMGKVFEKYKPSIVFHAAAYKHVPMMEQNPYEAVRTNINGTKIIADLSAKTGVKRFVMISTDKAVNPTNVMGASKRVAEIYTQSLNKVSSTSFITTRFGNVLGSNGSVIPRFKKQIDAGGPVTVTHPDITRYFMTIPEACQLVLEASAMGKGGEIFIFDMGKLVKIVDLAKKMIKLSGLELGRDIHLTYTGLRPGEKLYEELLADEENNLTTHHSQIMIAKIVPTEYAEIKNKIDNLICTIEENDKFLTVKNIKEIVPEFISKNSEFEALDKQVISN